MLDAWAPGCLSWLHFSTAGEHILWSFSAQAVWHKPAAVTVLEVLEYLIFLLLSHLIVSTFLLMKILSNIWQLIFCCVHLPPCWLKGNMKSEHSQAWRDGVLALPSITLIWFWWASTQLYTEKDPRPLLIKFSYFIDVFWWCSLVLLWEYLFFPKPLQQEDCVVLS